MGKFLTFMTERLRDARGAIQGDDEENKDDKYTIEAGIQSTREDVALCSSFVG